jgi:UDPglucose 6-dehydrogenase
VRITVIGTGYLGAVHAACMADIGHDVLGVDIDSEKISALAGGQPPFFEPGLTELLVRGLRSGRLRFGSSLADAARFGEVHFICVGTPQLPGSFAADISGVETVIGALAPQLTRNCLIVGKSTVPVGTAARMSARIVELAPVGAGAELAWNPEFLREGFAVQDTLSPDRLVIGVTSSKADAMLRSVYEPLLRTGTPCISTDLNTAELVKVSANAFLATKISFINAMADLCEAADADVVTLALALGHDSRIGQRALSAGLGFGGSCLPKDLRALVARGGELGVAKSLHFLYEVDAINTRRRSQTVQLAREMVGGSVVDRNVAVLGAAFKPYTDDVRDSPALDVAVTLQLEGARVRVHDPKAADNARAVYPDLDYALDVQKACEDADVVLHLTEWPQYQNVDPLALRAVVRSPRLLDARNALPLDKWQAAGWTVHGLGVRAFSRSGQHGAPQPDPG